MYATGSKTFNLFITISPIFLLLIIFSFKECMSFSTSNTTLEIESLSKGMKIDIG